MTCSLGSRALGCKVIVLYMLMSALHESCADLLRTNGTPAWLPESVLFSFAPSVARKSKRCRLMNQGDGIAGLCNEHREHYTVRPRPAAAAA